MSASIASPASGAARSCGRRGALGVAALALALTAADHFHAYSAYVRRINLDRPLVAAAPVEAPAAAPLARRIVVIFVDGLGFDAAAGLPALAQLARRGTRRVLGVDFPSFTYPAVVALATGLPPRLSGMRINYEPTWKTPPPTLLDEAARARLPVRICSGGWPPFAALLDPRHVGASVELADLLAPTTARSLDFVYFGAVDAAGHAHGGRSAAYRAAAAEADAFVGRVAAALDPTQDALVVMSDHGQLRSGGHGGAEAAVRRALFVAAGAGVRARADDAPPRPLVDVAPTLAALTGLVRPASSIGEPMLDVLDAPPAAAARIVAATRGAPLDAPGPDPAAARRRVALAALVCLLIGGLLLRLARPLGAADLLPTVVYLVVFATLYFATGYRVSWSIPRGSVGFMVETLGFGALACLAALVVHRRRRAARLVAETAVMTIVFGVPYVLCSAWVGLDLRWPGGPTVSYLVPLLATVGFYAHGPFGVALLVGCVRRRRGAQPPLPRP